MSEPPILNLVAVRTGTRYGREYVSILFDMLLRNLSAYDGAVRLWCITDDPREGLPDGVTPILPDPSLPGYWQKVALFAPHMPWLAGETVAYFDLDVAITGRLEDLIQTPGIMRDELWPCYNSSVMVWRAGDHADVWTRFDASIIEAKLPLVPHDCLPVGVPNGGDQEWITLASDWTPFPREWCVSYKTNSVDWPTDGAKVVIFNGTPKNHECGGWVKEVWKCGGFTSLPQMTGANVETETIFDNIAQSSKRDLPWFRGSWPNKHTAVLVCGGPSLKDSIEIIRQHKRNGARVFTVNNTLKAMLEVGITPDAHIMLDARPENIGFLQDVDVRYFLASQCDASLFDQLDAWGRPTTVWHAASGDPDRLEGLTAPYLSDEHDRSFTPIPGGGTVGLRALWLLFYSGYRKLRIYGLDGSYDGDAHHAYAQPLNEDEQTITVMMNGKPYRCALWMARQASEFQRDYAELNKLGMQIWVGGRGIIPDMAEALRQEWRAA